MKFKNLLFRAQNHCEMEEEMATHFTILAGKIPWTEEPIVHEVAKSWTRPATECTTVKLKYVMAESVHIF